jgi:tetratricopeptide (TPR) repeat protein
MKFWIFAFLAALALACPGCVHTPPGTSVEVALAKKAELHRLPEPAPRAMARGTTRKTERVATSISTSKKNELVADAFSRGQFCMKAGKDQDAIAAFEEAVRLDPNLHDAWQCLAILYEKTGEEKKALEAFRRSKRMARG